MEIFLIEICLKIVLRYFSSDCSVSIHHSVWSAGYEKFVFMVPVVVDVNKENRFSKFGAEVHQF